jgi:hypothetical protein
MMDLILTALKAFYFIFRCRNQRTFSDVLCDQQLKGLTVILKIQLYNSFSEPRRNFLFYHNNHSVKCDETRQL